MIRQVIQDWTATQVELNFGSERDVKYQIYKEGDKFFQDIVEVDDTPIYTFELPDGLALDRSSYEVMLRYVLADVIEP